MKLFLIRHGETPWTLSGQHTGRSDPPLTERGQKEALDIGERLKNISFEKVLCSPSLRARETCRIAGFLETQAEITHELSEWDYGRYEGLTSGEILKMDPSWSVFSKGAPDGESVEDITQRAHHVLSLLQGLQGNAVLFSSGHFLRALTAIWLQLSVQEGRCFYLSPGSLSILGYERLSPVILLYNNTQ
ncbi:MAG: histidine phosphatase family protein [Chlamydiota bacterium]